MWGLEVMRGEELGFGGDVERFEEVFLGLVEGDFLDGGGVGVEDGVFFGEVGEVLGVGAEGGVIGFGGFGGVFEFFEGCVVFDEEFVVALVEGIEVEGGGEGDEVGVEGRED